MEHRVSKLLGFLLEINLIQKFLLTFLNMLIHQHSMGQTRYNICNCCPVIVEYRLLMLVRHGFGSMMSFVRAMKIDLLAKTKKQSLNLMRQKDESSCAESSTRLLKDDRD